MVSIIRFVKLFRPYGKTCILAAFLVLMQVSHAGNDSAYRTFGDYGRDYIPAIAGIISLCKQDYSGVGLLYLNKIVTSVTVEAVKRITNVERPDGGKLSFPSRHSADAFVGAGYLHMRYGFLPASPFYVAAGLVAHSRVYANRHRYIDVMTGAAIAITTSYFCVKPYKNLSVRLIPTKSGNINLGMKYEV